jgi:hypothetical protein
VSEDALVMVYEVEGPGCSPWLQDLPEVLGKVVGWDPAYLTFEPAPRKKRGAVASFQSVEEEPDPEEGSTSRWLVHVYELPFQPSGRTGSFRVKKKPTPPGSIPKPEPVWRIRWRSGEIDTAYKVGNCYFFYCVEGGQSGPYGSLAEAVTGSGLDWVSEATGGIESPVLSAEQIAPMLKPSGIKSGFKLSINGEEWVYSRAEGFQPASPENCDKAMAEPQPQEESLEDLLFKASANSRPEPGTPPLTPSERQELVRKFLGLWQGAPKAPDPAPRPDSADSRGRKTTGDKTAAKGKKRGRKSGK